MLIRSKLWPRSMTVRCSCAHAPRTGGPVYMLAWDERSRMHKLMPLTASAALMTEGDVGTTLAASVTRELLDLIERSGVMLAPHAEYHLCRPND